MMVSSSGGKELAGKEISVSANINISQTRQMMHFEIVDPGQQVQPHFPRIDGCVRCDHDDTALCVICDFVE